MALTAVGLDGMRAAVGNFSTAVSSADKEASNVDSVGADLQGSWKGDAATIYQGALTEWQTHWQACRRALTEMQQTLEQTNTMYGNTHQETQSTASQTQSAMGALPGFNS